jgi:formylglycine-generating enzyme required for sulfatase activity
MQAHCGFLSKQQILNGLGMSDETPRHRVYLEPFQIASRTVTCREYLDFMLDDAYTRVEFGFPKAGTR